MITTPSDLSTLLYWLINGLTNSHRWATSKSNRHRAYTFAKDHTDWRAPGDRKDWAGLKDHPILRRLATKMAACSGDPICRPSLFWSYLHLHQLVFSHSDCGFDTVLSLLIYPSVHLTVQKSTITRVELCFRFKTLVLTKLCVLQSCQNALKFYITISFSSLKAFQCMIIPILIVAE